ncbi:UNVERIFIED_CONTAM: hypothetical protein Slati_3808600 [Sesamum latifolium]|uniref:Uncharacterized protein n=1 Tax=Sesamum latifolium TaxID=2727402 RepID=A0AAW2U5R0_9LAMI
MTSPDKYTSSPQRAQMYVGPSGSRRRVRRGMSEFQAKKCNTMDRLNESLQDKIDWLGPKATESLSGA